MGEVSNPYLETDEIKGQTDKSWVVLVSKIK